MYGESSIDKRVTHDCSNNLLVTFNELVVFGFEYLVGADVLSLAVINGNSQYTTMRYLYEFTSVKDDLIPDSTLFASPKEPSVSRITAIIPVLLVDFFLGILALPDKLTILP